MNNSVPKHNPSNVEHFRVDKLAGLKYLSRWIRNPVSLEGSSNVPKMKMAVGAPEFYRRVQDMRGHPVGRRILADRPDLGEALGNASLASLPQGTLGRCYFDHANVEGAVPGYLLAGLIYRGGEFDQLDWNEDMKYLLLRLNNIHDLVHQLCGYETDLAGEALTISYTMGLEAMDPTKARRQANLWTGVSWLMMSPSIGWKRYRQAVMEAYQRGVATASTRAVHNIYFEQMLALPVDTVREELGVPPLQQPVDTAQWQLSGLGNKIARGYRKAEDDGARRMRWMDQLVQAGIPVRTLVNLDEALLQQLLQRAEDGTRPAELRSLAGVD